jgi:Fe-S cluster assembly protein SufB
MATPEVIAEQQALVGINADYKEKYGFFDPENYAFKAPKGLTRGLVEQMSEYKNEPQWMREFRLKALDHFLARPMPTWGSPMLAEVDFDNIHYFVRASERSSTTWDDVPDDIKNTFERLGIPEAERKFLSGVGAQYESEVVYHQIREDLEKQGVVFMDMDSGLREHEDLVREYFAQVIPPNDNKLAALNSAVWSGGSFVYVPPGVHVEMPLQAYFRINTENMGQFERTLIIADEGSYVHYVEGCTAPVYTTDSLHSAVVELIAKPGARIRYTTVQNWSQNVYNLVTKRAIAESDATVEWVDCNLGSKLTMKYPSVYLMGERAHGEVLSIAFAGNGQHQDAGAKIIHVAPNTTSNIFAKSISKDGGRSSYRGLLEVAKGAHGAKSTVVCDALLLDEKSRSDTYPTIRIGEDDVNVGHEASVSKIGEEQLFYLMSRGIPEDEAAKTIVNGFIEPIVKELPDGVRRRDEPADRAADGGLHWLTRPPSSSCRPSRGGRAGSSRTSATSRSSAGPGARRRRRITPARGCWSRRRAECELVQVDGGAAEGTVFDGGPVVLPLSVARERYPELVEPHLGSVVQPTDAFTALQRARLAGVAPSSGSPRTCASRRRSC